MEDAVVQVPATPKRELMEPVVFDNRCSVFWELVPGNRSIALRPRVWRLFWAMASVLIVGCDL